ncbi:MAG: hypothetical protein LBT40_14365 [Deltaproteobacteria bacterium]|nr:hypothetical protein [Deltaproteobacteria bacterium]
MKNRRLIHRTSLTGGAPVVFEGADVISWTSSIAEGLAGSPGLADFLADPVKVPADGWINWYTNLEGEPWPLPSLSAEKRQEAADRVQETMAEYRRAAERLKGSDRFKMRQAGEIMLAAVSVPQALSFFWLDGSVVCAGWGMSRSAPLPFEPEAEPAPEPEIFEPPPPEPEPEPYVPPPPPPPPPPPKKDWKCLFRRVAAGGLIALAVGLACLFVFLPDVRWALSAMFLPAWGEGSETRESVADGLRDELDRARAAYFQGRDMCLVVPAGPAPKGGAESYLHGCYASPAGVFYDAASSAAKTLSVCVPGSSGSSAEIVVAPASGGGAPCRIPASLSAEEGRALVAASSEANCGESVYPPLRLVCEAGRPDGTQAGCVMEEDNGSGGYYEPVPVELRKPREDAPASKPGP